MKAIIELDVPDYQIGQKVSIYFKDTMMIKAIVQEPCVDVVSKQAVLDLVDGYSESRSNVEDVTQDIISDIVALPPINPRKCDNCEVRNPCLYCKHKFEQRERNDKK